MEITKSMLSIKESAPKTYLMKKFVKKLDPSPQQLLNEQGCKESPGYKNLKIWNFCERNTEVCGQIRKRKVDICCLQEVRKEINLLVSKEGDASCGGLEIRMEWEVLEF